MKKYLFISLLLIIIAVILIYFYKYREQNLGDLLDIGNVNKVHIITQHKGSFQFELKEVDQEYINKLTDFLNQYQVKLTNVHGWVSKYENERFELFLGYKNGKSDRFTIEHDVVVSTRVYKVLNAPLDYKWIQEFERNINPK
ncbi:hypothetical protein IMZ08_17755 [Bacillus luteolus]|uniref:Uncharacterized protein n=1 Tax=Litchfieldia luteola TaxID=682179 RepID=A0ABR9QNZ0_9BACI|nr:hypothetical protein [Cytobacillus luteolus]MBE4909884.1 hypothetical protein [Cytobacillus luteolus]MBP1942565.1 hypothetical protein [Cytobacillus luteolus]